jgi:tRNA A37 threonylcarbamoyladenosine biosynthesis protein TsaE
LKSHVSMGDRPALATEHVPGTIGREAELAAVGGFLDTPAGPPAALVLEGEAGIGKTTLWRRSGMAFARVAEAQLGSPSER